MSDRYEIVDQYGERITVTIERTMLEPGLHILTTANGVTLPLPAVDACLKAMKGLAETAHLRALEAHRTQRADIAAQARQKPTQGAP